VNFNAAFHQQTRLVNGNYEVAGLAHRFAEFYSQLEEPYRDSAQENSNNVLNFFIG
jgi:hypothetical protein